MICNKQGNTKEDYGHSICICIKKEKEKVPCMDGEVPCRFEHDGAVHLKLYASATADRYQADRSISLV